MEFEVQTLQSCFPLNTVAKLTNLLLDSTPSQLNEFDINAGAGDLFFLRDIARMSLVWHLPKGRRALSMRIGGAVLNILKRSNAARASCSISDKRRLVLCWGLGAQIISELISAAAGNPNNASALANVILPKWMTTSASCRRARARRRCALESCT